MPCDVTADVGLIIAVEFEPAADQPARQAQLEAEIAALVVRTVFINNGIGTPTGAVYSPCNVGVISPPQLLIDVTEYVSVRRGGIEQGRVIRGISICQFLRVALDLCEVASEAGVSQIPAQGGDPRNCLAQHRCLLRARDNGDRERSTPHAHNHDIATRFYRSATRDRAILHDPDPAIGRIFLPSAKLPVTNVSEDREGVVGKRRP